MWDADELERLGYWNDEEQPKAKAIETIKAFARDETGSEQRFHDREPLWEGTKLGGVRHAFWWALHNCVAHPMIGVLPIKATFDFHDWTSRRLHNGIQPGGM